MSSTNRQGSKTPGEMLKVGALVFIVPIAVIIFLINMNLGSGGTDRQSMAPEMVLSRIAPVAHYNTGAPLAQPKSAEPLTGEQVYNKLCMTCHDTGLTDSPIKGNTEMWAPRIAQGADVLFKHSLEGFNAMPAKGGDLSLSDDEVKNAVVFMVNASGGNISADGGADAAPAEEEAPVEEASAAEESAPAAEEAATVEETPAVEESPAAEETTASEVVENAVAETEEAIAETATAVETATQEAAANAETAVEEATEAAETAVESAEQSVDATVEATTEAAEEAAAKIEEATSEAAATVEAVVEETAAVTEEVPLNQQVLEQDSAAGTVSPTQTQDPASATSN
ncbi:MAG: c-type cytochrome [Alcaligenaceae bacterium]|nr:c-type cytochrome [Alcaligenaceae bacterium]